MTEIANPGLFNLQALAIGPGDSHARPGPHIRVAHHPRLGLPTMPFVLERADIGPGQFERLAFRTDAVWRDSSGKRLEPPFSMKEGDEITVTLPTDGGATALWAEIIADPGSPPEPSRPVPIPFPFPFPDRPIFERPRPSLPGLGARPRPDLGRILDTDIADVLRARPRTTAMQVEAFVRSATGGSSPLGTRSDLPFAFSGTGLVRFVIRGNGAIVGIRWLDGDRRQKIDWRVVDILNLPHEGGRRYVSLSGWEDLCRRRVEDQTPQRRPMQDLATALPRFSAPGHSSAEEHARVDTLFAPLKDPLGVLITGPTPQHQHVTRHNLERQTGGSVLHDDVAEATIPTLSLVLQGQADPGTGSWMGYKTLDTSLPDSTARRLSFYRVTGYFRDPTDDVLAEGGFFFRLLVNAARNTHGLSSHVDLFDHFLKLAGNWLGQSSMQASSQLAPFTGYDMGAMAVADHFAPLDPLEPPQIDTPRHRDWLPAPRSAPRRAIEAGLNGVPPAGALAVQMRQPPSGSSWRSLNRTRDTGAGAWRTLILPSPPGTDPSAPTTSPAPQTLLTDNNTGPEAFRLHAANMDRFGRYSDWASTNGAAGPRPRPPKPVLIGSYRQPEISSGSHSGRITATVPLPEDASLAPGAFPLERAELTVLVDGLAFGPTRSLPVGDAIPIHPNHGINESLPPPDHLQIPDGEDQFGLRITFDGPPIPPTQSRPLRMTVVWVDTAGQTSVPSDPVRLTMTDPYPPAQIPIPDVLDYAARPDATGTAWVERDIPGSPSQRYAVYYADENRLRDHLRRSALAADATLLATLEAEPDPAARATALRAAQARFPGTLFERLEGAVETTPNLRFRHGLPGTLRVLSAYKVAVESGANAAGPDLTALDTIFYGVPNSDPPARPSVTVRLVDPEPHEPDLVAEVTVTLRAGLAEGAVARIRRTRSGVVDPIRNPVVATVAMGPVDPATGLQTATFRDIGAAQVAPSARLMAFIKYAWIAEVQGAPEPGSVSSASGAVPGLWSAPSAPATLTLVPAAGPVPPTLLSGSSDAAPGGRRNIRIDFAYPLDLTPGTPGPWRVRVERAEPQDGLELVSEDPAPAGSTFAVQSDPAEVLPVGTRYRVRLIDPVGRESPAIEHIV